MTTSSIPDIDLTPLLTRTDHAAERAAGEQMRSAITTVGPFTISGALPEPDLLHAVDRATRAFFAQPFDARMAVHIDRSKYHRGFAPLGEEHGGTDHNEVYELAQDLPAGCGRDPMAGPNQWPDLDGFREPVEKYFAHMLTVARAVFRGLAIAMDEAPDYFDPHLRQPSTAMRLLHYPHYPPGDRDRTLPACHEHTDYECFTILRASSPGLEQRTVDGEWVATPPVPGRLAVTLGQLMEVWTNGEFPATTHRVRQSTGGRCSWPVFCTVDYWTPVAPRPQFVSDARPARAPVIAGQHLWSQTAEAFSYLDDRVQAGHVSFTGQVHDPARGRQVPRH
ncbi:isopenicillin N synthase family dioxygenase [Actinokineospora inagensis]|uniref:isopenicillin N synthase family dioxygenase n=1 Tax=Actinokineospora inagensis TaxID=103730 RepID=UPI000413C79A|nr:2OG-Fe(II) oxygenase family protein [Actinokineospora inagensis]